MSGPVVSVIITTFNRRRYLEEALKSVAGQTFRDFEVVVLDDGSDDGTVQVLSDYRADFPFSWSAFDRRERSYLRNVGAREAKGEYLAFLDDDDEWLPEKLAMQVEFMRRHRDVGLVYCRTEVIDAAGRADTMSTAGHRRLYDDQARRGHRYANLAYRTTMFTSAVVVRRSLLLGVGGFDERYVPKEDLDFYLRCSLASRIECVGRRPLVRYRSHPGGSAARLGEARIAVSRAHLEAIAADPGRDPDGSARRAFLLNVAMYQSWAGRHGDAISALGELGPEATAFLRAPRTWPLVGRVIVKWLRWRFATPPHRPVGDDLDGSVKGCGHAERIDPVAVVPGILSLHRIRYEFAKPFCAGKEVLDIACGAGYGTKALAGVARRVVGVDVDDTAIRFAGRHDGGAGGHYFVGDAMALPFADGSFDVVVSFETIEHLPNIPRYLAEIRRVLRPHGVYLVSTPRVRTTTYRPRNPHHTVEYAPRDFEALLTRYFGSIELYGQVRVQSASHYWLQRLDVFRLRRFVPSRLRYRLDRKLATVPFEEMDVTDQKIVKGDLHRASDMVGVCRP